MKVLAVFAVLVLANANVAKQADDDRTITKVVKLLQGMLEKSKLEGEEEAVIYDKFRCYCENSEREKRASIKLQTELIEMLESKIAEIQGDTGELSSECAQLKTDMAANKQAREEATALREKEHKAFEAEKTDLETAIQQMKEAIEVLSEVGGDQTMSVGADHKQFMAGHKPANQETLVQVQSQVQAALKAASALMDPRQQKAADSFLQAPFTGTYTSQSGEVVGILKNMRDTFAKNLAAAIEAEKKAQEAYDKFMKDKEAAFKEMEESYNSKQKQLGANDDVLASKKEQLSAAQKQLASDQEFLAKLLPMCEEKAKGYANRKILRANEEAAIAQAISILNSDNAFETFGTVSATSTGATGGAPLGFLQLRSVRKHMSAATHCRRQVETLLQKAAHNAKSERLSKVLALVQAENPFEEVLSEIAKMLEIIEEEAKKDEENLEWCNSERTENDDNLATKKKEILGLEEQIDTLESDIKGLKKDIANTEDELVANHESQVTETKDRTDDNLAYQKDIKNLVDAQAILKKALKVLKAYYDDLDKKLAAGEALVQEDPNPPEAWKGDGAYEGQSAGGADVIKLLESIMDATHTEETTAHSDEEKAQADYEDSMQALKEGQAKMEKNLVDMRDTLATREEELIRAKEDLKKTIEAKEAIEAYLAKIKPSCDFITKNIELRKANRLTETDALNKAVKLIKETPAYKAAVNEATEESYGKCKEICVENKRGHAYCEACLVDVSVPGYCADHKEAGGCDKADSFDAFWLK